MIAELTPDQARAILGATRRVGTIDGATPLTPVDRLTLDAAWRHVFRGAGALDVDALPGLTSAALAEVLPDPDVRRYAIAFVAIMALVDGTVDARKIALVVDAAKTLDVHADYLKELTETVQQHMQWVTLDMMRYNVEGIAGLAWDPRDPARAFLPYEGPGRRVKSSRRGGGATRSRRSIRVTPPWVRSSSPSRPRRRRAPRGRRPARASKMTTDTGKRHRRSSRCQSDERHFHVQRVDGCRVLDVRDLPCGSNLISAEYHANLHQREGQGYDASAKAPSSLSGRISAAAQLSRR